MRIVVIGCGSIGKRHLGNLCLRGDYELMAYDIDKSRLQEVKEIDKRISLSTDLKDFWKREPQVVFVTTPTSLHIPYALDAVQYNCHLFVEKPLSNTKKDIDRLSTLVSKKKIITMVGCNMRFYWAVSRIKKLLESNVIGRVISAHVEFGQYLPDWHPWEDYRHTYSAQKKLGGGVILDAIHELDYAMWFFGMPKVVCGIYGKQSTLEIDTEDTADMFLKFPGGPYVSIHIDYLQRRYTKRCKIIGEEGTLLWNYDDHVVKHYSASLKEWKIHREPKGYTINQMYIDETDYFLSCIHKKKITFNTIDDHAKVLNIAFHVKQYGKKISRR